MPKESYKCLLISSFTINNFAAYLSNDGAEPRIDIITASSYDQVSQVLLEPNRECWQQNPDFAVVWTQPERVISSFRHLLENKSDSIGDILSEVDQYTSQLINIKDKIKYLFVPTWTITGGNNGLGLLEMKHNFGITNTLMKMNLRLAENLDQASNIFTLNAEKWIGLCGKNAFDPKLWYMAKIAYSNELFLEAAKDVKAAIRAVLGMAKKLIVLDLDDILWGDVVGEVGWQNIKLGGHDYIGESYVDFQKELKALANRGIILAIASKNDEDVALQAIKNHPEMILKQSDFAGWKINWEDKAKNIAELVEELNLGLQSTVFIDDSPVERARVREVLTEVYVPDWPRDSMLYKKKLQSLRCFDTPTVSKEDIDKSKMYSAERERKKLKRGVSSLDEWLQTLDIMIKVDTLNESNIKRTAQLLNKTNQMNLSTRRLSENELVDWEKSKNNFLRVFYVSDKYGDSGLTGLISMQSSGREGNIIDFILSCRVMGRKIEETMLSVLCKNAQSLNLKKIMAHYSPTNKNKPCLNFFSQSGFAYASKHDFSWDLKDDYPAPSFINIQELNTCDK